MCGPLLTVGRGVRFCIVVLGSFDSCRTPLSVSASVISVCCPQRVVPSLTTPVSAAVSAAFPNHVFSSSARAGLGLWGSFVVHLSFCCLGVISCVLVFL